MSKSINTWRDMQAFGINALTGEACAFSMRLLCDVNEDGAAALAEYLGIKPDAFLPAWNSQVGDKPSLGSAMLDRAVFKTLARFLLFRAGALACTSYGSSGIIGIDTEERLSAYREAGFELSINPTTRSDAPHEGSRAVHAMSGRAR